LVQEGLRKIAEKLASVEHVGPKFVADFEGIADADEWAARTPHETQLCSLGHKGTRTVCACSIQAVFKRRS